MQKILIQIEKGSLVFKKYEKKIEEQNLNNTNIISTKNLVFSSDYMEENNELVSAFLKIIVLKNEVVEARIDSLDIAQTALSVIVNISVITKLYFRENNNLNYSIVELIMKNPNIEFVNCYYMPEFLFDQLTKYNNCVVQLRNEIFTLSDFMEYNHLYTYSDIYYKKKLLIKQKLTPTDFEDIDNFIAINNSIKQLSIYDYERSDLEYLLSKIPCSLLKGLRIEIEQKEENTELLMKEIPYFKKLEKKYQVKIRIRYSKGYKEKNFLKQLNLQILKFILVLLILAGIVYFLVMKYREQTDKNHTEEIQQVIKEVEQETKQEEPTPDPENSFEETKPDAYHTVYEKAYPKLLEMNPDTIGWLRVSNTNIDYPVVQSSDNDYYLNRSFDYKKSSFGWIYADYRNQFDPLSKNTIIYGHNVRNTNLMFATLKNVLEPSWYENSDNLIISFSTLKQDMKWQIFSVYTTPETNDYLRTDFDNDDLFLRYLNQETERSFRDFGVEVNSTDSILTLSTCYKDNTKRLVVHAKRIK